MNFSVSILAEVDLHSFESDEVVETWLKNNATFTHNSAYEFIHHLYQDESESWYKSNILKDAPNNLLDIIITIRRAGAHRICFYS